eukprot:COSAG06_NODE_11518_length_1498_cov_1.321658_2_plen_29_part_01
MSTTSVAGDQAGVPLDSHHWILQGKAPHA